MTHWPRALGARPIVKPACKVLPRCTQLPNANCRPIEALIVEKHCDFMTKIAFNLNPATNVMKSPCRGGPCARSGGRPRWVSRWTNTRRD